jgi:hypothetical protein
MFNGLINSTQVQPQRHSLFTSSGGTTHRRRTEQDIATERIQWMRQNEEYQLQMHEYYRQQEEQ